MWVSRSTVLLARCTRSPRPVSVTAKTSWPNERSRAATWAHAHPPRHAPGTRTSGRAVIRARQAGRSRQGIRSDGRRRGSAGEAERSAEGAPRAQAPKIARRSGDGNNDPDGGQDQHVVGIDGLTGRRHASIPKPANGDVSVAATGTSSPKERGAMAIEEAQLEEVGSGLAPVSPGWFVLNAGDAAWVRNDALGGRCVFESSQRVLMGRPDVEAQMFPQTGFTLAVLEPGKPSGK